MASNIIRVQGRDSGFALGLVRYSGGRVGLYNYVTNGDAELNQNVNNVVALKTLSPFHFHIAHHSAS